MPLSETLRHVREKVCVEHMTLENAHAFPRCIQTFRHARYEVVPTNEIYDGGPEVDRLLSENKAAFPDFHYDVEQLHHADTAIIVEGTFRGTHLGTWRGLPATGRKVEVSMLLVFRFEGEDMVCERVFFDLHTVLRQLGVAWDPNSFIGKISTVLNHPLTIGLALCRKLLPKRP